MVKCQRIKDTARESVMRYDLRIQHATFQMSEFLYGGEHNEYGTCRVELLKYLPCHLLYVFTLVVKGYV